MRTRATYSWTMCRATTHALIGGLGSDASRRSPIETRDEPADIIGRVIISALQSMQPYNGNSASDKVAAIVVLSLATGDIMLFKVQHSHPA